jgi:hypothetical protein
MKLFHGQCEVDTVNKRRTDKRASQSSAAGEKVFRNKQDKNGKTERPNVLACRNCGRNHEARKCPAYGKESYKCQKKNHFAKMCRSESKQGQAPNKRVREITADSNDDFVIDAVLSTLPYIPYMSYIVHQISVEQYCNDFTFSYSILRHYN